MTRKRDILHFLRRSVYFIKKDKIMDNKITIRSDRKEDYTFQYKGEDVTLKAGSIIGNIDNNALGFRGLMCDL
jgi:hypothetical protein